MDVEALVQLLINENSLATQAESYCEQFWVYLQILNKLAAIAKWKRVFAGIRRSNGHPSHK